jgi:hypothetical protein
MRNGDCIRDVSSTRVLAHRATGRHKVAPTASAMLLLAHHAEFSLHARCFVHTCIRLEWDYEPNGVGATLCRPVRRNGVISFAIRYMHPWGILIAFAMFHPRVYSPTGRRADIKWPLQHPRRFCLRTHAEFSLHARRFIHACIRPEWDYEPNGVGATLCRPERRNGVI